MAIMMITHNLGVIAEISDQIVVMYAGEVVEHATIETFFRDPRHPYTMGLIHSIPKLGAKFKIGKQRLQEIKGMVPNLIHSHPGACLVLDVHSLWVGAGSNVLQSSLLGKAMELNVG